MKGEPPILLIDGDDAQSAGVIASAVCTDDHDVVTVPLGKAAEVLRTMDQHDYLTLILTMPPEPMHLRAAWVLADIYQERRLVHLPVLIGCTDAEMVEDLCRWMTDVYGTTEAVDFSEHMYGSSLRGWLDYAMSQVERRTGVYP